MQLRADHAGNRPRRREFHGGQEKGGIFLVNIQDLLRKDAEKDLLRFTLVGSVDDGKSTLIGRLLHDARGVYEDQLSSVRKASRLSGIADGGEIDFSLITDGLKAEREQKITIDV